MIRVYLAIGLLVAFSVLGWYAKHQTERAATAEQAAQIAAETADAWRIALEQQTAQVQATDKLLAQSRRQQDALRIATDMRVRGYEDALRNDVGAADWDAVPVPAAVALRMCEYRSPTANPGPLPKTAGDPTGTYPDPPCRPTNGHLWRWAERMTEVIERGNQDKAALKLLGGS